MTGQRQEGVVTRREHDWASEVLVLFSFLIPGYGHMGLFRL